MKAPEELADRIEEAREDGESMSAAVRRLVRGGIRAETEPPTIPVAFYVMWLGTLFAAPAYVEPANPLIGPAGLALTAAGLLLASDRARHAAGVARDHFRADPSAD